MATQYVFQAGGDACGVCAALDGTVTEAPMGQVHENCQCQSVPVPKRNDCPQLDISDVTEEISGGSLIVSAEIAVTCCDGSEIGESVSIDLGETDVSSTQDIISEIMAASLEIKPADCGEGIDVWLEDGEEEGAA